MKTWDEWIDHNWAVITGLQPCPTCKGHGSFMHIGDHDMFISACTDCKGSGAVQPNPEDDFVLTPWQLIDLQRQYIAYLWAEVEKMLAPLRSETPTDEGLTLLK